MRLYYGNLLDGNDTKDTYKHYPIKQTPHKTPTKFSFVSKDAIDVRSPDFIEQRLENLKRRPSVLSWLDEYANRYPESDTETDNEDDEDDDDGSDELSSRQLKKREEEEVDEATHLKRYKQYMRKSLLKVLMWSILTLLFSPFLILFAPFMKNKPPGFWPLGCDSVWELLSFASSTFLFICFGLFQIYWLICQDFPEMNSNALTKLKVSVNDMYLTTRTCIASFESADLQNIQELCMKPAIDLVFLLISGFLLFKIHRKWGRYATILIGIAYYLDAPSRIRIAISPAPQILSIDPSYALVGEELLVAIEGKNLKAGGTISWVAYWGCASTSLIGECEKQFPSTFEFGVAPVTFASIDHFIPCYRDPPNPLRPQEYRCFENIKLRVKDKHSIPGWSMAKQEKMQPNKPKIVASELEKAAKSVPSKPEEDVKSVTLTSKGDIKIAP